jgi:hypothetical protein
MVHKDRWWYSGDLGNVVVEDRPDVSIRCAQRSCSRKFVPEDVPLLIEEDDQCGSQQLLQCPSTTEPLTPMEIVKYSTIEVNRIVASAWCELVLISRTSRDVPKISQADCRV